MKRRHSWKNSRMPPYVSIEARKEEESKVIPPKIRDDFHKWNRPVWRGRPRPRSAEPDCGWRSASGGAIKAQNDAGFSP